MILFYSNITGDITANIDGRVHTEDHLMVTIDPHLNDRIVFNWRPHKFFDKNGVECDRDTPEHFSTDYEPALYAYDLKTKRYRLFDIEEDQKEILKEIDKISRVAYLYKIDLKTKRLVKKTP